MNRLLSAMREFLRSQEGSLSWSESFALKAVSLLLALILWITILGFKKEELEKRVPLKPLHSPDLMITNEIPSHITFVLSGPRVLLKKVEQGIGAIQPDYLRAQEGVVGFPVREDLIGELPTGVRVVSFTPVMVQIRLEKVLQRAIPVHPIVHGEAPEGMEVVKTATPARVQVIGPKSVIEGLEFIPTEAISISANDPKGADTKAVEAALEVDKMQKIQLIGDKAVQVKIRYKKKTK